jgi:hypothetical protein
MRKVKSDEFNHWRLSITSPCQISNADNRNWQTVDLKVKEAVFVEKVTK